MDYLVDKRRIASCLKKKKKECLERKVLWLWNKKHIPLEYLALEMLHEC